MLIQNGTIKTHQLNFLGKSLKNEHLFFMDGYFFNICINARYISKKKKEEEKPCDYHRSMSKKHYKSYNLETTL